MPWNTARVTPTGRGGAFDKLFVWLVDTAFPLEFLPPYETISDDGTAVGPAWREANADWFNRSAQGPRHAH